MKLPVFFVDNLDNLTDTLLLDGDTSRHIVCVLRMKKGEQLHLTNGKGLLLIAEITDDHKKKCHVKIVDALFTAPASRKILIGISLLKNGSRFEWFLEKATEIGVTEIIPLICERTERQQFRQERMKNLLVSAMIQSQQVWLPVLHQPISFPLLMRQEDLPAKPAKYIAHCMEEQKIALQTAMNPALPLQLMLIGPEGDFTKNEIDLALDHHFVPVAIGETRLRAETAGVVAAALLKIG